MRIKNVKVSGFKRFTNLTIGDIPEHAQLVVVTGPNGSGKSAIFEALNVYRRTSRFGVPHDPTYFNKGDDDPEISVDRRVVVDFHDESVQSDQE